MTDDADFYGRAVVIWCNELAGGGTLENVHIQHLGGPGPFPSDRPPLARPGVSLAAGGVGATTTRLTRRAE